MSVVIGGHNHRYNLNGALPQFQRFVRSADQALLSETHLPQWNRQQARLPGDSAHLNGDLPLLLFTELKRGGIDAITQAGRFGAVFEDVTQVPAATRAKDFR